MQILNDIKKDIYMLEQLIKVNNGGTFQEKYMNQAYDIIIQSLKHIVNKYE